MTACVLCAKSFSPRTPHQTICSDRCLLRDVNKQQKEQKARARLERSMDRRAKEALKTIPQLIKEAQIEFNAYIRERDKDKPCICCGRPLGTSDVGGGFDCGHYRSTGSAPHLRFTENNAHAQRKDCNRWGAGRAVDYRIGLVARIGLAAVEALESDQTTVKWTREQLREIKAKYRQMTRDLKAGVLSMLEQEKQ